MRAGSCGSFWENAAQPRIWNEHLLIFHMFRESETAVERQHQASARVYTGYSMMGGGRIQPCTPFVEVQGIWLDRKGIPGARVWLVNCSREQ